MNIEKAVEIIEDMLDRFSDDGVFVYHIEEDAIKELVKASEKLEKIRNTIDYWIEDCGSDDTMYMVEIEDIVKGD